MPANAELLKSLKSFRFKEGIVLQARGGKLFEQSRANVTGKENLDDWVKHFWGALRLPKTLAAISPFGTQTVIKMLAVIRYLTDWKNGTFIL